ncbi:MAG: hypothetical protein FWD94_03190 [Treponema sp.]|nr:hypothetical protein [Treponema sp.]
MFTLGHIVVLGITILLMIFFRLLDRSNRSLNMVRKYVQKCKDEIAAFAEEKGAELNGFGISLDVEKKAANKLLHEIGRITREELAQKVQALAQMDERIHGYDASLTELIQMTGRVQENLNRIRDEAGFVDGVSRRLAEIRERVEAAEGEIGAVIGELENAGARFQRENALALKTAVDSALSGATEEIESLEGRLELEQARFDELFSEAVAEAGGRARRVEEAALAKVTAEAEERVRQTKAEIERQVNWLRDSVNSDRQELEALVKDSGERWDAEVSAMEAKKEAYGSDAKLFRDEWDRNAEELSARIGEEAGRIRASLSEQTGNFRDELEKHRAEWADLYRNTGLELAGDVERKLEAYQLAQEEWFNRLSGVADDSAGLEGELRILMKDAEDRVRRDFAEREEELNLALKNSSGDFTAKLETLRSDLAGVEEGLSMIRETASEKFSGKLKIFEEEFMADLAKRGEQSGRQIDLWQSGLESRLQAIGDTAEAERKTSLEKLTTEIKRDFAELSERIVLEMDALKARSDAFEERADREIRSADEARSRLAEQLEKNIVEAKKTMEEIRRESNSMTKTFERSGTLRKELEIQEGTIKDGSQRLTVLNEEVAKFEAQFTRMKQLEDEISARITRFVAEKRRIDGMENDFTQLLSTSRSVEEKLAHISNSNDLLQAVQVKIRQLDSVIDKAEEKYQRVERKTQTMQETIDGIDRNFHTLQESEALTGKLQGVVQTLRSDMDEIRKAVEKLSAESGKAKDAAEKLSTLDDSVKWLEERIGEMNRAREMVTRLASEMKGLEENIRGGMKLAQGLGQDTGRKTPSELGSLASRDRENIVSLKRKGWSIEQIARSLSISKGQVELVLELEPKDS